MNADPISTYIQLLYYIVKPGIGILYDELLVFSFLRKQNFHCLIRVYYAFNPFWVQMRLIIQRHRSGSECGSNLFEGT
jgi:hypothetical protein